MAMGRQKDGQGDLMVSWSEMPRSPGHVFYDRLQSVLIEGGFDAFAEASCRPYYAARMGAPSVPPGRYFRMHLVGYFEGIDSERGLEWRCSDSLSLRAFLRLGSRDRVPDHSWLSRSRTRLPHEVHAAVFDWVLVLIAEAGLIKGERIGVDASTMEANAALRNIVRRDNGEGYREMLERLARESGVETPTAEDLARLEHKRKGKKLSNTDWVSKSDPEAKIAKMKDGTTHLAYKPEHAVDLDTGAVVAAELHPGDEGDTTTLSKTLAKAEANLGAVDAAPTSEDPAECVADKGYHSRAVLRALNDSPWKTRIAAPKQTGFSRWHGDEAARRAVTNNRARLKSGVARRGLQAARRDRRALLCPQPRSWRHATNLAARARECAQAIPAPRRRPQSIVTDAPAHRRRHPAGGRGGRIWRYFRSAQAHRGHDGGTGGSQSGQTAFAAAFLIWGESRKKPLNQRAVSACCQAICHRGARSIVGSPSSATTASLRRSITLWSWPTASGSDARPARAARLSTARASRRPRLVAPAATMRARRSRGASATRWSTPTGAARGASGEYPGPRWWRAAAVRLTRLVSVHREGLCRQRLRRREGRHGHRDRRRDRAQKPRSGRLRRPTAPLGRGALLRLDQPQPATGKGFRGHHRLGPRLPLRRLRHAPPPQIGPSRMTFETDSKAQSGRRWRQPRRNQGIRDRTRIWLVPLFLPAQSDARLPADRQRVSEDSGDIRHRTNHPPRATERI